MFCTTRTLDDDPPPAKRAKHRRYHDEQQHDVEIRLAFAQAEASRHAALARAAVAHGARLYEQVQELKRLNRALENRVAGMAIRASTAERGSLF